jgi:hypothetical protein
MRTRRILVVAAMVLATGMLTTSTAQAGGWAETVLDPTPAKIESTVTYTFGFWVLQHGSYPIKSGDLGQVALTAVDDEGNTVSFPATGSVTEGHYFAEVVFPHDSVWQVGASHELLMADSDVATVTVPGAVRVSASDVQSRAPHDWGTVRPSFPPTASDAQAAAPMEYAPPEEPRGLIEPLVPMDESTEESTAADTSAAAEEPGGGLPIELVVAGGLAVLALAAGLGRRYARGNRRLG